MKNAEKPFAWSEDSLFWKLETKKMPHSGKNTSEKAGSSNQ